MQSISENNLTFGLDISWPKDFLELKQIDDVLHCGICYEYLKTVMVTPCAHSYCSICIRKFLSYKTACPTCFEEVFETSLRNNRVLDRVVELFTNIRDKLIKHLKIAAVHFNCNEKSASSSTPSQNNTSQIRTTLASETPKNSSKKIVPKATSSKGKLNFSTTSSPLSTNTRKSEISKRLEDVLATKSSASNDFNSTLPSSQDDCEVNIPTVPSMFLKDPLPNPQARTDAPLVSCPICFVDIPERVINTHLDKCLANADKPAKSPTKRTSRKPLPKMVWTLMGDKDLRKKLKEYGLPTQGEKRALISRIQRYIVLYNSECDSENPRSVTDIVRQVEREEKMIVTIQTQQRLAVNKKTDPRVIEEQNKKYVQENKQSFNKLIEKMREREGQNIRPLRPLNRIFSSDEEDNQIIDDKSQIKSKENEGTFCKPSTSNDPQDTVNLCESTSSSPILDSWIKEDVSLVNGLPFGSCDQDEKESEDLSSGDIFLPETRSKSKTPDRNSIPCNYLQENTNKSYEKSDLCDTEVLFNSSPSRPPSASCIISARSDSESEDSISILINQNIDDELSEHVELPTENVSVDDHSQLCDPDFVLHTEDQEQEELSEEVFVKRKSKRKQSSVNNEIPSPRRTRRRLNK